MKFCVFSLSGISFKILLFGLIFTLLCSIAGLAYILMPTTPERLEAVSAAMNLALRGLVMTTLLTVITDLCREEKTE